VAPSKRAHGGATDAWPRPGIKAGIVSHWQAAPPPRVGLDALRIRSEQGPHPPGPLDPQHHLWRGEGVGIGRQAAAPHAGTPPDWAGIDAATRMAEGGAPAAGLHPLRIGITRPVFPKAVETHHPAGARVRA